MIREERALGRSSYRKNSADYDDCEDSLDCFYFYSICMATILLMKVLG